VYLWRILFVPREGDEVPTTRSPRASQRLVPLSITIPASFTQHEPVPRHAVPAAANALPVRRRLGRVAKEIQNLLHLHLHAHCL
jgi:hypothetical protein